METRGLGHRNIVRDPGVVSEVVGFVTGGDQAAALAAEAEPGDGWLDQYLYQPEARWTVRR